MRKYFFAMILAITIISTCSIALARHWRSYRSWRYTYYYAPHRPTYVVYSTSYDLNHDGVIDVRDRLCWINKHYVPNSIVKITIVSNEKNFLCELDLNKNGVIESSEMAYWVSKYDINKNGRLEEYEIRMALV